MDSVGDVIRNKSITSNFRNTHEFQAYGNRLAEELGDIKHRALYIRFAKKETRKNLDIAREFALGYKDEPNKGKLFMWRLKQLRSGIKLKPKEYYTKI